MKRWKPALVAAGVFLALIAVFVLWVDAVAARRWEETRRRTKEIEEELAVPLPERRALRGETVPGDAKDDFAAAEGDMRRKVGWEHLESAKQFVSAHYPDRRHEDGHPSNPLGPTIARIRAAARRAIPAPLRGWAASSDVEHCMYAQARCDAASGRIGDAFELLTDFILIGFDSVNHRIGVDHGWGNGALRELHAILSAYPSPREASLNLTRELELLESAMPPSGQYLLHRRIRVAEDASKHGTFGYALAFGGPGWRHLWSSRLYFTNALDQVESWGRSLASLQHDPWTKVARVEALAKEEAARSGNGFLEVELSSFNIEMRAWSLRTRLRLARTGAAYRADGRRLELDDPFGGKLLWDESGVRSRGPTDDPKDDIILRLKP